MDAESRSETEAALGPGASQSGKPEPETRPARRAPDSGVLAPATILVVAGIVTLILGGLGLLGTALALSGAAFLAFAFRRPEAAAPLGRLWESKKGRKVFLGVVGVAFLLGAFTGGSSREKIAATLVTESYQESGGSAKCVKVKITGEGPVTDSWYAEAKMSNGRTVPVLITDDDKRITVSPIDGAQFGMFPKSRKK